MIDSNIKENVAFGEETINSDLLNTAIKQASLNEFVGNLPKGVESEVGERGSRLSGGQKQRYQVGKSNVLVLPGRFIEMHRYLYLMKQPAP